MVALLRALPTPLFVRPSCPHGHNDCLTDSALLALMHYGYVRYLGQNAREFLCARVRQYLEIHCNLRPVGYPFLQHDAHFHAICTYLRTYNAVDWLLYPAEGLSLTLLVYDRFNRQRLEDVDGVAIELPETNPVYSAAPGAPTHNVVLLLHCHTSDTGDGYHYERIQSGQSSESAHVNVSSQSSERSASSTSSDAGVGSYVSHSSSSVDSASENDDEVDEFEKTAASMQSGSLGSKPPAQSLTQAMSDP